MSKEYYIKPVPKPRMTQRDKWKKRPCVIRYHEFKDAVRDAKITLEDEGEHIIFVLPMPKSWSKKKKKEMCGKPHQQKPDKDNLEKALLDALFQEDCAVWDSRVSKIWGPKAKIIIKKACNCITN